MKKTRKLIALFLAVIMIAGALAACGKSDEKKPDNSQTPGNQAGNDDKTPDDNKDDEQKEEVKMETIKVWSDNAHEKEVRDKQIAAFNEGIGKELGINIEYTVYGSNFTDTIKIAAQAGEAPDLFRSDSKWMQEFVDSDYLVALEDLPGSEDLLNRHTLCLTTLPLMDLL